MRAVTRGVPSLAGERGGPIRPRDGGLARQSRSAGEGALPQLRRICGVDEEDLADMIRELRGWDPKPGLRFATNETQAVVPDLFVTPREGLGYRDQQRHFTARAHQPGYYTELSGGVQDKNSKAWLSDCLASANWLVKAPTSGRRRSSKVATEIVRCQGGVFPTRRRASEAADALRAVAETIGMHESTVSRVTSNKYLADTRVGLSSSNISSRAASRRPRAAARQFRRRRSKSRIKARSAAKTRARSCLMIRSSICSMRKGSTSPAARLRNIVKRWGSGHRYSVVAKGA